MVAGLDNLANGLQKMMEGFDALEAENLHAARDAFRTAEQEFDPLVDRYSQLEDDPDLPRHMEADIIELSCIAAAWSDAATAAKLGVDAGLDEEWDIFDERLEETVEAMERC